MISQKRTRAPRKASPGVKPLPRRLSDVDLKARQQLVARRDALQRAAEEIHQASSELDGAWAFWRDQINPKYQMTPQDSVADDGTITRA
jgi:hypothetical protein